MRRIERIVKDSSSLVVSATAEYETDLARIRHAANQLMALMGEMKIASADADRLVIKSGQG